MYITGNADKEMVAQVGTLSQKIIEALGAPGQELESQEWKHSLFEILSINHGYLRELGVSIPEIEEIVERNTVKGAKSSKLTGAGMGGYALVVECPLTVPPSCSDSDIIAEMDLKGLLVEYF
jgi:mevalonate kinase